MTCYKRKGKKGKKEKGDVMNEGGTVEREREISVYTCL